MEIEESAEQMVEVDGQVFHCEAFGCGCSVLIIKGPESTRTDRTIRCFCGAEMSPLE